MGWIPGKPAPCSCGLGDTSRSHLMVCTLVPSALWCCLPVPPPGYVGHHIDYGLKEKIRCKQIPARVFVIREIQI
ncbi:hypothetical protein G6F43_014397 [Rhizopus delemar]|nr:hypothetical protein G6F43_014397 [Rhizopus delemar]